MDANPQPEPTDLSQRFPRAAYRHLVHALRAILCPPIADTPEGLVRRDHAAIARACHRATEHAREG